VNITVRQVNPGPCKTYLITNDVNREAVIIDPVLDRVDAFKDIILGDNLELRLTIDTHTHADHISGGAALKDLFSCDYAMHTSSPVKCASFHLDDGTVIQLFNRIPVTVLHTPGHTRDSVCLVFADWIFTGDTLFLDDGGAGRDDLPGGDAASHWKSLRTLHTLSDHLVVHPAHDYRSRIPSALGKQKATNPHLLKALDPVESFVQYLDDLRLGPADWMKDVLNANYACARDPKAAWIPADLPACEIKGTMNASTNEISVPSLSVSELREHLDKGHPPLLLDVREREELTGPLGHLEGIVHIPVGSLTTRLDELEPYREKEIISVCRSGGRAATAAQILIAAGFKNVIVLEGGMIAWNALM